MSKRLLVSVSLATSALLLFSAPAIASTHAKLQHLYPVVTMTVTEPGNYILDGGLNFGISASLQNAAGQVVQIPFSYIDGSTSPLVNCIAFTFDRHGVTGGLSSFGPPDGPMFAVGGHGVIIPPANSGIILTGRDETYFGSISFSKNVAVGKVIGKVTFSFPGYATAKVPIIFE